MKKIFLSILFLLMICVNVSSQTAITSMTEDTSPTSDDLLYSINNPAGVPGDRKVQIGNLPKAWGTTSTELGYTSGVTSSIQNQLNNLGNVATDVIWDAAGDLIQGTGANTGAKLSAGTAGKLLRAAGAGVAVDWSGYIIALPTTSGQLLKADGTNWTASSLITAITIGGFTASYGVESNASGNLISVQPTGTGLTVRQNSPTLVTPSLGAATATSLLATGIVDGTAPVVITATSADYQLGATYKSGYTFINPTSSSASNSAILPAVAAGYQYCVGNYAAKTGVLTVSTKTGSGVQYIDLDGVLTANTGHIQATAVAGNFACFVGMSSSVWKAIPTKGTWTKD